MKCEKECTQKYIGFMADRSIASNENVEGIQKLTLNMLKEDGMTDELARRIDNILQVRPLNSEDVLKIALTENSMFMKRVNTVKQAHNISVDADKLVKIAIKQAYEEAENDSEGMVNRSYSFFNKEINKIVLDYIMK